MGADVRLEPVTADHVEELAPKVRAADAAEVLASGGYSPREALEESVAASDHAFALVVAGEVLAIWGVVGWGHPGAPPAGGIVWAITGAAVEQHRRIFWRQSRVAVSVLLRHYPMLFNYVDARYTAALRWVRRLGFEVQEARPFGVSGLPFHPIVLRGVQHV